MVPCSSVACDVLALQQQAAWAVIFLTPAEPTPVIPIPDAKQPASPLKAKHASIQHASGVGENRPRKLSPVAYSLLIPKSPSGQCAEYAVVKKSSLLDILLQMLPPPQT
jgi:hypothetical protein